MSLGRQETRRIAAPLAHRVGDDATATQIADAVVATWQEIVAALTPLIGQRGVAALYRRSLHVTGSRHAWLASTREGTDTAMDLAALKSVLAQQSSDDTAFVASALLQTFYESLTALIGPSLTERLLRSVWTNSLSAPPAQENSR